MSYAPDETAAQIFSERTWLQGVVLCGVAYGVEVTLFSMCFYLLFKQTRRSRSKCSLSMALLVYTTLIVILGTCFMTSDALFTQYAFIDNRNYPGGPGAYENDMFSEPADEVGNIAFVLANWLADGLVVWRFMVIYKGCRFPLWAVMFFPCTVFASSIVLGSLWLIQVYKVTLGGSGVIDWTISYFTTSLALNILLTIAIVIRLLIFRHRVTSTLGPGHGSRYTSIAAMIVESAAAYSIFAILFLVPFVINSPLSQVFMQALGQVQNSATLLIVFRVALGRAWSSDTQTTLLSTNKTPNNAIRMRFVGTKSPSASSTVLGTSSRVLGDVCVTRDVLTSGSKAEPYSSEADSTHKPDSNDYFSRAHVVEEA